MKNNRVDDCRELYRGSFKKAQLVAFLAGMIALAVLIPAGRAGYLPDHLSGSRLLLGALAMYALTLATMMWIPGRAMKKSRRLDGEEAGAPTPSQG